MLANETLVNMLFGFLKVKIKKKKRNRREILVLILSKFKGVNQLLFIQKSSENQWFSDDFSGNEI